MVYRFPRTPNGEKLFSGKWRAKSFPVFVGPVGFTFAAVSVKYKQCKT